MLSCTEQHRIGSIDFATWLGEFAAPARAIDAARTTLDIPAAALLACYRWSLLVADCVAWPERRGED